AEHITKRGADREVRVEDVDPFVLIAEPKLLLRKDHPFALDPSHGLAAQDRALAGVSVDDRRTLVRVRNDRALGEIRRTGDDRLRCAGAVVDGRELQLVGVRMLRELLDARGADLVVPPRTLDALHLGARHMKLQCELIYGHRDIDVLAQPGDRNLYQHFAPRSERAAPKPSLRGGGPPGLRPVPHRAGALGAARSRLALIKIVPDIASRSDKK